jgi:hypothetical protein
MRPSAKTFLAAIAFALLALPGFAQMKVNPKVGLNFSGLDVKLQDITAEARVGWNAGLDFRMGDGIIYFAPGAHYYSYTARLIQEVQSPDDVKLRDETTIQNLKVPINLGLRLTGDNGLLGVHLRGGVMPSMLLGVTERADFAFDRDRLNTFTWGANMGVGVDFLFLTLDANYELGMSDFFKNVEGRNNMLTVSVGLKF